MTFRRRSYGLVLSIAGATLAAAPACSSEDDGGGGGKSCSIGGDRFEPGDPTGHADVYGAKAAGQARAGRITSAADVVQPAHGRQRVSVGDFVLANDKVAFVIEDKGLSDGYARFGGEILSVDRVGDDGRPIGQSYYVETLMALGVEMINPETVSVLNDGSDGQAAVVRVAGPLEAIPFMDGALGVLFPRRYGLQAAYDYVLEPGSERLLVRLGLKNPEKTPVNIAVDNITDDMHGFFQLNMNQFVTAEHGFAGAKGKLDWAGFVNPGTSFAWRSPRGQLNFGVEISGFVYTLAPGFTVDGCTTHVSDHAEIIAGGFEYDALREAIRRVDDAAPWRTIEGVVRDSSGAPVADALVHALGTSGEYLSRTRSASDGSYVIHAPAEAIKLVPQASGYPLGAGVDVDAQTGSLDLPFASTGTVTVTITDADTATAIPARVQVIPQSGVSASPAAYGQEDERNGRLHQAFAVSGETTLVVPPGTHRLVVSRGYEYEHYDQEVTITAGQTEAVAVALERSVDSTGWMCADFHIHSKYSADSSDPAELKVVQAIADGLEIPVSSEHEWIIDFQPIIAALGLTDWAFGMPSEELTTFTWGHFGVVPLFPKPDELNNGAVEWIGRLPPEMFADVQGRPEDPFFIVNHPSGGNFGSYFSQAGLDATGVGKDAQLWSDDFDGIEVFNDSDLEENRKKSFADWMAILKNGKHVYAVGSSDSHHVRSSPVGYPRTCLFFGHDDPKQLTANIVRDVLASGQSTISGGLFMTVEGPGGEKPGAVLNAGGSTVTFTITVQAPSWIDATELETFVNGESLGFQPLEPLGAGTGQTFVNQVTVTLDASRPENFVLFHAKGESDLAPLHPGRRPFAVSNPIFIKP